MHTVSNLWNTLIVKDGHWFEMAVVIGDSDQEPVQNDELIMSMSSEQKAFGSESPSVGNCTSAELSLTMIRPDGTIERGAKVRPYIRVTDGTQTSEWVPQGVFYIDTREYTQNDDNLNLMTLHCYDAMLKTEAEYPEVSHAWPMRDADVAQEIADTIGVEIDERTWDTIMLGYRISFPAGYSMREVLGNIASMYAGNWIMNYDGELLFVPINSMPPETNYLIDEEGYAITFGGDRILV